MCFCYWCTAYDDVRLIDAIVSAGVVFAGLAASFASASGCLSRTREFRFQFQPARANGRSTVPSATAPAAPIPNRHHREHVVQPIPAAEPAIPVRPLSAPTAVCITDYKQGVADVIILRVAGHQSIHVRR